MDIRTALSQGTIISGSNGQAYTVVRLLSKNGGNSLAYYAIQHSDNQLVVLKELFPYHLAINGLNRGADKIRLNHSDLCPELQQVWKEYVAYFIKQSDAVSELQVTHAHSILPETNAYVQDENMYFSSSPFFDQGTQTWYKSIHTGKGCCLAETHLDNLSDVIQMIIKICKAVLLLHETEYLHLDIKPENIFITASDRQVKLLDYDSLAKCNSQYLYTYSPGFSAPELLTNSTFERQSASVSFATDTYSITAVLFWMLFGHPMNTSEIEYTSELSIAQMSIDEFPTKLIGYSLNTISSVFSILRKGLSYFPQYRYLTTKELCLTLEELYEICLQDEATISPALDPEGFVYKIGKIHDFLRKMPPACTKCFDLHMTEGNCFLLCQLLNSYVQNLLATDFSLIQYRTCPKSCIKAIEKHFIFSNKYEKALLCLQFIERNSNIQKWDPSAVKDLYNQIISCAIKTDSDPILSIYRSKIALVAPSASEKYSQKFAEAIWRVAACEESFDFIAMVDESSSFIKEIWGGPDAVQTLLMHQVVDQDMAKHAGQMVEAICLCRIPNWENTARAVSLHVLDHLIPSDEGFQLRSLDNALHVAIETKDRVLFSHVLYNIPEGHMLALPCKEASICEWIQSVSERFNINNIDEDSYSLYVFLKSINTLFVDTIKHHEVFNALNTLSNKIQMDVLGRSHPSELIMKHTAILNHRLGNQEACSIAIQKLNNFILENQTVSLIHLIAKASILEVCTYCGTLEEQRLARESLTQSIRCGIENQLIRPEYFLDVLKSESSALFLSKFRFKHT